MDLQQLSDIQHFYYCITIAVKIEKREGRLRSPAEENLFILHWVRNARGKNIFPKNVFPEIEWIVSLVTPETLNFNTVLIIENVLQKINLMQVINDQESKTNPVLSF